MKSDPIVGTLNESSLHAALKDHYSQPGDEQEVAIDQFVADICRHGGTHDQELIEIQTSSFAAMGNKLDHLLPRFRVTIVHPIVIRTRLQRPGKKPRLSPKRGSLHSLFDELVSIPTLLDHPNLVIEVVLVDVTKVQESDPSARRGRGGFRTVDKRLTELHEVHRFTSMADVWDRFVPGPLEQEFTTADLATTSGTDRHQAQQMAYCFRHSGQITEVGRNRAGILYSVST